MPGSEDNVGHREHPRGRHVWSIARPTAGPRIADTKSAPEKTANTTVRDRPRLAAIGSARMAGR